MAEAVKVVVRCRPMNSREKEMGCVSVMTMDSSSCTCHLSNLSEPAAPRKSFRFDGVYGETSSTEIIYNEVAYPLIEGVPEGYNCTVFAYGQTGCGKSFTMQGPRGGIGEHRGIVPRALEQLFEAAAVSEAAKFLLAASFLEIHNEEIRDLLSPQRDRAKLELREHPEKGVYVHELSTHAVHNREQCLALMERGWAARSVGATLMNADSSRSHCIFSVNVERMEFRNSGDTVGIIRRGKLNLVDLAGSERQAKTGASGDRLKEATKINLSLSALGNVISALVDGRTKHIPYRDSKLTRLLQDSLGGNTKTLMIACLSPADYNYDETLSTLRYAHRAKSIENSPRVNEDPKDAMLRQYQNEIEQLRRLLNANGSVASNRISIDASVTSEELRSRFEHQVAGLRAQFEAEQRTKEQLQMDLESLRSEYAQQLAELARTQRDEQGKKVTDVTASTSPTLSDDVKMVSPTGENHEVECQSEINLTASQREVLGRLRVLQASMVGGELAHDHELKERRQRQLRASERRLKALASALGRKDEEDAAVLQVYDDIEHELAAKSDALRRARAKIRAHEGEIKDLQREFETERTDYLETIRRQDRQIKLFQQISSKMATAVKSECNYSDIDRIKSEAVWNDDTQKWKLPDLVISRTKLPPAGPTLGTGNISPPRGLMQPGGRAPSRTAPARISSQPSSPEHQQNSMSNSTSPQDTLMQKLERSEQENLAGNYFKPKRATELLIKAQEEAGKNASQHWRADAVTRSKGSLGNSSSQLLTSSMGSLNGSSGSGQGSPLQQAIAMATMPLNNNNNNNNATLNQSWGNNSWAASTFGVRTIVHTYTNPSNTGQDNTISPELFPLRKPTRLEALPLLDKMGNRKRAKAELNTMDML